MTKGAVASEVRGRGRGWEMNLQETPVSNGGPLAEGGPSPRHSASGDFSGRCAHGAALRRPDGSVATAAPQPSGKEEDSCALALLTAAVSGHPEHRRLSTGTSASLLSSAFVIFFSGMPRELPESPRSSATTRSPAQFADRVWPSPCQTHTGLAELCAGPGVFPRPRKCTQPSNDRDDKCMALFADIALVLN